MAKLLLNGSRQISFKPASRVIGKLIAHLEKCPTNEVFDAPHIVKTGIIGRDTLLRSAKNNEQLVPYRFLVPVGPGHGFYVFGHPAAIKEAEKQFKKTQAKS